MTPHLSMVRDRLGLHTINRNVSSKLVVEMSFIPKITILWHILSIVGVGKRGAYYLVYGYLPMQHPLGITLRFTGPVPMDSRQLKPSVRNCATR